VDTTPLLQGSQPDGEIAALREDLELANAARRADE
jgi:hypothetical protein